jgi:hypothetical protein
MAAESGVDFHHFAPRCLLRLFDVAAGGLADWSELDAEAERLSIEVRGLSREDLRALIESSTCDKSFDSSAVRGVLWWLVEMIAEILRPLLCPLPRHAYPPLFYAFFVVGNVPEFPELRAGLGVQNGLHRFFDGLPGSVRPGLRLAHQDLVGHLLDASIVAHGARLFLAETLPKGEYNPARFLRAN